MEITSLTKVLTDFNNLNIEPTEAEPTFMEISGYPHFENVCSNILKFFFMSEEVHGLKDLMLKALLRTIGLDITNELIVNDVIREQLTGRGNRIDIIVETDEYIIGIENKIYALLTNDLQDYSTYLQGISNGRKLIKVVLSLHSIAHLSHGFVNVKYDDFFSNIDQLVGSYWHISNNKYLSYLDDFINSIRRLEGGTGMNSELLSFINENKEEVEKIYMAVNDVKKELRQRVQALQGIVTYNDSLCKQWLWRENEHMMDDLVHDIYIEDAIVAVDTNVYPVGWIIYIWLRRAGKSKLKNKQELADWLIGKGLPKDDIKIAQNRQVYEKKLNNTEEVAKQLQDLLNKLC